MGLIAVEIIHQGARIRHCRRRQPAMATNSSSTRDHATLFFSILACLGLALMSRTCVMYRLTGASPRCQERHCRPCPPPGCCSCSARAAASSARAVSTPTEHASHILVSPIRVPFPHLCPVTRLKHRGMSSPGLKRSRSKDPPNNPLRIARALQPSGALAPTLWQRIRHNPSAPASLAQGLEAHPSIELPIDGNPRLILSRTSCPGQRPGRETPPRAFEARGLPERSGLGGSSALPNGHRTVTHSSDKVMHGA